MDEGLLIGGGTDGKVWLDPRYANRHGLVAGATGTGKTVTLQCLAEGFSQLGVPVFLADVKGDLAGISQAGEVNPAILDRLRHIGIEHHQPQSYPVALWDLFGQLGTPVRATITEMGPQLLSRLLDLNDTQEGVMTVAFEYADQEGMLLLDLPDLRSTLVYLADHRPALDTGLRVARNSVNAILRRLLVLEREGAEHFFGEPALQLEDFRQTSHDGRGVINLLAAGTLIRSPRIYATFLLWLLAELFESLPEVGDPERPVLVFFFDEAHLLFRDAPRALLHSIEQVVRLIRSKGVGVYFVTQSPADIPDPVLGQLGNRVQHALRAYTPRERKAVRVAAQSFRDNPELDTETAISELGVGEALVSTLGHKGVPTPVQRVLIRPPHSRIGQISAGERDALLARDHNRRRYLDSVDRYSAHEILAERTARALDAQSREESRPRRGGARSRSTEAVLKDMARAAGTSLGRQLLRGLMGSLLKR